MGRAKSIYIRKVNLPSSVFEDYTQILYIILYMEKEYMRALHSVRLELALSASAFSSIVADIILMVYN